MMQATRMPALTAGVCRTSTARRGAPCVVRAGVGEAKPKGGAAAAGCAVLAAVVLGASAPSPYLLPPASADDSGTSAYEQRKQQTERRKQLLAQARQKAELNAAAVASNGEVAPPVRDAPALAAAPLTPPRPKPTVPKIEAPKVLPKIEAAAQPSFSLPAVPSFEMPKLPSMPAAPGLTLPTATAPEKTVAIAPAAVAPAPPAPQAIPAPRPAVTVVPVPVPSPAPAASQGDYMEEWRKQQSSPAAIATPGAKQPAATPGTKRNGSLHWPLWLAEILVIGSFAGVGVAATKFQAQSEAALQAAGRAALRAAERAAAMLPSGK